MTDKRRYRTYPKPTVPQIRRMTDLRKAGLSIAATAVVVNLDWETNFTENQVRWFTGKYGGVKGSARGARVSCHNEASAAHLPKKRAAA